MTVYAIMDSISNPLFDVNVDVCYINALDVNYINDIDLSKSGINLVTKNTLQTAVLLDKEQNINI